MTESIDALDYACPRCGARAGLACRDPYSRAKRRPAAGRTHVARGWAQRRCPTCKARWRAVHHVRRSARQRRRLRAAR